MQPNQPDDAGSPSPEQPPRRGQKPIPPAVVYALDCLDHGSPAHVRRHMVALGYTPEEAAEAVRLAIANRASEPLSTWEPQDSTARRCMSLGFTLFICGVCLGCIRVLLEDHLPDMLSPILSVGAWGSLLVGIVVFWLGIAQMRIGRQ